MIKKNKKTSIKIKKSPRKDQLMVLVENLGDEIKLVAEGNLMLQEKMDAGFQEVNKKFGLMEREINYVKQEMDMGFKTVIAALVKNEEKNKQHRKK